MSVARGESEAVGSEYIGSGTSDAYAAYVGKTVHIVGHYHKVSAPDGMSTGVYSHVVASTSCTGKERNKEHSYVPACYDVV